MFHKLTAPQLRYPPSMQKVPPSKASRGQKKRIYHFRGNVIIFGRFSFLNMCHFVAIFEICGVVNLAFPDHSTKSNCLELMVSPDQLLPSGVLKAMSQHRGDQGVPIRR